MRKSMKKIVILTALGFTVMGLNYVYAKIIPGIDCPFDPPNYYSPTSISWADTNNPSFFFRDLARQGMRVLDVPREAKNNLSLQRTLDHLDTLINYVNNKIIDMTGLTPDKSEEALQDIEGINDNTLALHRAKNAPNVAEQKLFRTIETTNDPRHTFNANEQYIWADSVYNTILQTAKDNLSDMDQRSKALNKAVNNANQAKGNLAVNQSNTEIWALYQSEIDRRNTVLANYIALEAANDMRERDKALKAAEEIKQGMTIRVADPYHPAKTDEENYTRPKGLGFVDLK